MNWIVTMTKGYTSINFEFEECKEAMAFVELAVGHVEDDTLSDISGETRISVKRGDI